MAQPTASSSSSPSGSKRKRTQSGPSRRGRAITHSDDALTLQSDSIARATRIPVSLQQSAPSQGLRPPKSLGHIKDKKLRSNLARTHLSNRRAEEHAALARQYLDAPPPGEKAGMIETEDALERTARVTQRDVRQSVGLEAATKSFSLELNDLGPYRCDYSRNGRHLLLGGRKGHLAAFDWQAGKLLCEVQVRETTRDVKWLHNQDFFAAAQKKYVYIYDGSGTEIHRLKNHVEVQRMEFLPYHFLLATVGNSGYLKYQDTSTGQLVSQHRSGLGVCDTMAQNPLTAVLHLGHSNGTVTLWTPNLSTPAMSLLAHRGPVTGVAVSTRNGGREMATSGADGSIKVWDARQLGRGPVREWVARKPASSLVYSQRGLLGVGWGTHVSIYDTSALANGSASSSSSATPPGPYLTHSLPKSTPLSLTFCPYEDVLGLAHARGFTSLLVPGSGEPSFDSRVADPFETRSTKREREVRQLLDKVQPDMISLDAAFLGKLDEHKAGAQQAPAALEGSAIPKSADGRPYARLTRVERLRLDGKADDANHGVGGGGGVDGSGALAAPSDEYRPESDDSDDESPARFGGPAVVNPASEVREEKAKRKMRGKNSAMKRYLSKKKKNVVDPTTIAVREKLEAREKAERAAAGGAAAKVDGGALDVFTVGRKRF